MPPRESPIEDGRSLTSGLRRGRTGGPGVLNGRWVGLLRRVASLLAAISVGLVAGEPEAVGLPRGVEVVWDLARAYREKTATRERICVNGFWRWQPADSAANDAAVPQEGWGFFKVPGSWPGITSYLQKDSQRVFRHPSWENTNLRDLTCAWYEREVTVPADWAGQRVIFRVEYLNSLAAVHLDGRKIGELRFPGGELDLTEHCRPGERQVLSLRVMAVPLQGVKLSYTDSAAAREVKGTVERRGLCGDCYLERTPRGARLRSVQVATSVRRGEMTLAAGTENLAPGKAYRLQARVTENGRLVEQWEGPRFAVGELEGDRTSFTVSWRPAKLWDLHTPEHQYDLHVGLGMEGAGVVDELPPRRFGFREFAVEGRDFHLNGTRLFLSALPLDNAQVGAAAATYAAARESLERLRGLGINLVYTHHYRCEPGAHLGLAEILRAADDVGMLVALTQPHFSDYDWADSAAERGNRYAEHAAFYADVAGTHPSVVMYATSHNATGYNEDMNPDLMDGVAERRDPWARNNVQKALRAEALIRSVDPYRLVYHHASGNLGTMHAVNFYPNFVPVQEMSDWFETWATVGVKPLFLCEYGTPFSWDWAMYRGWFRGQREFGSAVVPWEFCLAEWNAQFFGDRAFQLSEPEKRNLRWEARQYREGRRWHRWDYPHALGSTDFPERDPVLARYYQDNWRAFRTWGLSANSPWEHHLLHRLRPGLDRQRRVELPVDWRRLQQPGFSPDFLEERYERMDLAYARADWEPTAAGDALIRNNGPRLAYIAGPPERFTGQEHLFVGGETARKQIIVINNSRVPVQGVARWVLPLPQPLQGQTPFKVQTGQQFRVPLELPLPDRTPPGEYTLTAAVQFEGAETQTDAFTLHVMPPRRRSTDLARVALFDPKGQSAVLLRDLGVRFRTVESDSDLSADEVLVVGKEALTLEGPAPDLGRVRAGLRVLVFEQTAAVLEQRLGFRVTEYGLRQVFPRVPDHPGLGGLNASQLHDWRGAATLLPPRLKYTTGAPFNGAPTVTWCDMPVTRAWRCGNQGNVASVLIEKPARGDFLPILDGGFSLQYSPLLEYREGAGLMLFCQMDVTGRTADEPAAAALTMSLLDYVGSWKPRTPRRVLYVGDPRGQASLEAAGVPVGLWAGEALTPDPLLILGPNAGQGLERGRERIRGLLDAGGRVLALGLSPADAEAVLPFALKFTVAEHISAWFEPPGFNSPLAGVGPADVHNRAPRALPLLTEGVAPIGNGVLALGADQRLVCCSVVPWEYDFAQNPGLKRTFRRTAFLVNRLLCNLGGASETPLLARWSKPVAEESEGRWREGLYLDVPEEWDDPYRFFRW